MIIKLKENGINNRVQIDASYNGSWNAQKITMEVLTQSEL